MLAQLVRRIGRQLRHGLVVAALALFTAVAVGASGAVLSSNPGSAADAASERPQRNALQVLRDLFEQPDDDAAVAPHAAGTSGAPIQASARAATPATPSLRRVIATSGSALPPLAERTSHASATPPLEPGDRVVATVSFYYCVESLGLNPRGDGGGFCGAMRDGIVVYPGAAACDHAYLGQRFRVLGDPLGRTYTCNDTGSAVHGLHRDIWFFASDEGWDWQRAVGTLAVLEVVR